jgi:phytanoyl-CoA dioxygenase PhyH
VVRPDVVRAGQKIIWSDLDQRPDDPSSWTAPVARLIPSDPRPFQAAFHNPRLFAAFDQLVGVGNWLLRPDLGYFVVRFPHPSAPEDTGWHIDTSFPPESGGPEGDHAEGDHPEGDHAEGDHAEGDRAGDFDQWRINVWSRDRALLMLFLFSDVGSDDAPTRIRTGSHLDVPALLLPAGPSGVRFAEASALAARASARRPVAEATGAAGDVYLCHPFLVHAAQPVRGRAPRLMAQPPLAPRKLFDLDRPDARYSPVETAIRRGLPDNA